MTVILRNRRLFVKLMLVSVAMFGFGYLLSPLYLTLCRITGVNQLETPNVVVDDSRADPNRTVVMQFDSNLRDNLPWKFTPTQTKVQVHPGELVRVSYDVSNTSDHAISGQAIASYAPSAAAGYVRKLKCFCFSVQTLAPHEVRQMPVVFLIDPSLPKDVPIVTLSYTFFLVPGANAKGGA